MKNRIKALSLFANVGIAESYLEEIGIDVVVANEIDPKRTAFYSHVYILQNFENLNNKNAENHMKLSDSM